MRLDFEVASFSVVEGTTACALGQDLDRCQWLFEGSCRFVIILEERRIGDGWEGEA